MANISVRGLDEGRLRELKQEALAEGVSLNRRVLQGGTSEPKSTGYHDLDALIGAWTEEDGETFAAAVAAFEAIDPALWD